MYAIIETCGKQYKVTPGEVISVDRLPAEEDSQVELDRVLLIADGDNVTTGSPVIDGAKVVAKALGEVRDKKIVVLKYKSKVRYRKKTGHRQYHTRLSIDKIVAPEATARPRPAPKRKEKEVTTDGS